MKNLFESRPQVHFLPGYKSHRADLLLEPLLDGVEGVDGHGVDHRHLFVVVLVNNDHVKILQVELHTLKVDQLDLV